MVFLLSIPLPAAAGRGFACFIEIDEEREGKTDHHQDGRERPSAGSGRRCPAAARDCRRFRSRYSIEDQEEGGAGEQAVQPVHEAQRVGDDPLAPHVVLLRCPRP